MLRRKGYEVAPCDNLHEACRLCEVLQDEPELCDPSLCAYMGMRNTFKKRENEDK